MRSIVKRLAPAAAVLAAATTVVLVPATSASAEVYEKQGAWCENGPNVSRCAWVNVDSTNNRVRAYGTLDDHTSGPDRVQVNVCILENGGGRCATTVGTDSVTGRSPLISCWNGNSYRAVVYWHWNGHTGAGDVYSWPVQFNVC